MKNRVGADVQADFGCQLLHGGFVADQRRLDEALDCRFNRALHRYIRQRPDDRRGDGRKLFAALDEFVENVVVGGMAHQWVNGNGFSQRCKIAHVDVLLAGTAACWRASRIHSRPATCERLC